MVATPSAFMSYTRDDDDNTEGYLSKFRERLYVRVQLLSGCKDFTIFQDKYSILAGQDWQVRVYEEVDSACVFIAIMTPTFFQSEACRDEVERFRKRAKESQNPGLLLPIYYVTSPQIEDPVQRNRDNIAALLHSFQRNDWRELRNMPITSQAVRGRIEELAKRIADFILRPVESPREEKGLVSENLARAETVVTLQQIAAELNVSSFRPNDPTILAVKTMKIRELLAHRVLAHSTRASEVAQALDGLRKVLDSITTANATNDEITSGCDQAERLRKLLVSIILDR